MLTCNGLLPLLDIEEFCLAVDLLELESLGIHPLALHLTAYDRAFKGHDAKVMSVGRLDDDEVTGLDALA